MPELELRQPADERPELVVVLGGQAGRGRVAVFQALVLGKRRVEFWGQECEEQVQEVDAQRVSDCDNLTRQLLISRTFSIFAGFFCLRTVHLSVPTDRVKRTNIPSLHEDNPQEEEQQEHTGAYPAVGGERGRGIQIGLVLL